MENGKTKRLVTIAMLSAIAFLIAFLEIPILGHAPFLKIDFSDVPVFIGMYLLGPISGVIIAFFRSALQYAATGGNMGYPIGSTAGFVASLAYTLPIYYIIRHKPLQMGRNILAGVTGTISLTIILSILNYTFVLPAYLSVMGFNVGDMFGTMYNYFITALIPFNFIKGAIISLITFAVLYKMKAWLDRTKKRLNTDDEATITHGEQFQ